MKIISLFNNKGGVGKSTLCYHLGCALGEMGKIKRNSLLNVQLFIYLKGRKYGTTS